MNTVQPLTEWVQKMTNAVQQKARVKEQRHEAGLLSQAQAETTWIKGMDQIVQTLDMLVRALKCTSHFPQLTLVSHAQSPQGTTTYMRRGTLLSLKGLERESPIIEFEIDSAPPFLPDLLAPTVRVISKPQTYQAMELRQEHFRFGVSLQGVVVWQTMNPSLAMPLEGSVEEMMKSFLASLLLSV